MTRLKAVDERDLFFDQSEFDVLGEDAARTRAAMAEMKSSGHLSLGQAPATSLCSSRVDDQGIVQTLAHVWQQYGYVVDPHTACGFFGLATDRVSVVLATAHPAKFPEVVQEASGVEPVHPSLEVLKSKPLVRRRLAADLGAVEEYMRRALAVPPSMAVAP